ncbi:hypothetical protein [Sorangium sp. So ce363]|uniref:hypothetical protein n=1 Tax=Sorangium sp. So ce363 TaxID=3133304 RepID=UPI003F61D93D
MDMTTLSLPRTTLADSVDQVLLRGARAVLEQQRTDGTWQGFNDAGVVFTSVALVHERWLGALDEEDAALGVKRLRAEQRDDGSVPPWPRARAGQLDATCMWYAGMHAAGVDPADPALSRARSFITSEGGFGRASLSARITLALAGVIPADTLPDPGLAFRLLPGSERLLAKALGVNTLVWIHLATAVFDLLHHGPGEAKGHPIRARGRRSAIEYFTKRQDPSFALMGVGPATLTAAIVLAGFGVPRDDQRIRGALAYCDQLKRRTEAGLEVSPFLSDHWDTAQLVHALVKSGIPASHPAITSAIGFLVRGRATQPGPTDWQTPPRGAPGTGGWAYQRGNGRNPDLDSTAEVLAALALASPRQMFGDVIHAGEAWLVAMQNPDGGWGSFSTGRPAAPPGPLYIDPASLPASLRPRTPVGRALRRAWMLQAEAGDPSNADITGRVLRALGALGHDATSPPVARAIAFLRRHQVPELGAFWGRWACNYLAGTAYVLAGLGAVGIDHRAPWVARAVQFALSRQNADGGWGEDIASYADPAEAGRGPSMPTLTGNVLRGLLAVGLPRTPELDRAASFLVDRQEADGLWVDDSCYTVLFPHIAYGRNPTLPLCFALEGLSAWRGAR